MGEWKPLMNFKSYGDKVKSFSEVMNYYLMQLPWYIWSSSVTKVMLYEFIR